MITLTYSLNEKCKGKDGPSSAHGWKTVTTTTEQLLRHVMDDGFAVMAAKLSRPHKVNENIQGFELFIIDVDNDDGETTWDQAKQIPFIRDNSVCMWTSTNHRKDDGTEKYHGQDRYRILIRLPQEVRICDPGFKDDKRFHRDDLKDAQQLLSRIQSMIPGADKQCKVGTCIFGTESVGLIHMFNVDNILDINQVVEIQKVERVHNHTHIKTEFKGSKADSLGNLKRMLEFIPSDEESSWKTVCSALRNIQDSIGGEDIAIELFAEWSSKDYDVKPGEPERMFLYFESDPDEGGWGRIKSLAEDYGYEPSGSLALDIDLNQLLPPIEGGFKVNDYGVTITPIDQHPSAEEIEFARLSTQSEAQVPPRQLRLMIKSLYNDTGKIRFNELTQEIEICGEPVKGYHFEDARHWLDEKLGILVSNADAQAALRTAANENRYNPVREYLEVVAAQEESIDLDLVAERCLGVTDPLSKALVKCWLVGAVSKVMNQQGSAFIEVLTLVSTLQGIGKSEFFKSLASPDWFSDSFAHTGTEKDQLLVLHSAWINEISEIDQFACVKKDFKQMKGLISSTCDQMRVPYGRVTETKPRRFVIGATSNEEEMYSADDQQRRFWTINVQPTTECGRLDIKWLRDNRSKIWATATRLWKEQGDESFKLDSEQKQQLLNKNQQEFTRVSRYQDKLMNWLEDNDVQYLSTDQAYVVCDIDINYLTNPIKGEVNGVMKGQGYTKKRNIRRDGRMYSSVWMNESRSQDFLGRPIKGNLGMDF